MPASRYKISRQKSCDQCTAAKTRCDWQTSSICARCAKRGLSCVPPQTQSGADDYGFSSESRSPTASNTQYRSLAPRPVESLRIQEPASTSAILTPATTPSSTPYIGSTEQRDALDFSSLEVICPIDADAISTRWLNSYVPLPDQVTKNYPPAIISFIRRMLQSYASIAIRGRGIPPFVHRLQVGHQQQSASLSACLNMVRTCDHSFADNIDDAVQVLKWKMMSLYESRGTRDEAELLAIFQSHLIYSLVLHFSGSYQCERAFLRDSMLQLQELASLSARQGIVCLAEEQHVRPKWESWILCEAKRRTLYVMYMFDSLLLAEDHLPSFLGTELSGLPAPGNRLLWCSDKRTQWESAYNVFLADWPRGGLRIEELWPAPVDCQAVELDDRRKRIDCWLEDLDEFGVMLFTVTSCTHGS